MAASQIHRHIVAAILLFACCSELWAAHFREPSQYVEPRMRGQVLFVSDGDTITIRTIDSDEKHTIRLYGIDCPERSQSFGMTAFEFANTLVAHRTVSLHIGETDRYGRMVALVFLPDGRCLNDALLEAGLAWFHHPRSYLTLRSSPEEHLGLEHMHALMADARKGERGLWSERHPLHPGKYRRLKVRGDLVVYRTARGTRFHRKECHWAHRTGTPITLLEAKARGLKPCRECKPLDETNKAKSR